MPKTCLLLGEHGVTMAVYFVNKREESLNVEHHISIGPFICKPFKSLFLEIAQDHILKFNSIFKIQQAFIYLNTYKRSSMNICVI